MTMWPSLYFNRMRYRYGDRRSAIRNMGYLKDAENLIAALDDEDWSTRAEAAKALGKLPVHHVLDPLTRALADKDSSVRKNAVESLGDLRDSAAIEPLNRALGDEISDIVLSAIRALGKIQDNRSVDVLVKALSERTHELRFIARKNLAEIVADAKRWPRSFQAELMDEPERIRATIAEILGSMGPDCISPLIWLLSDEDHRVRRWAAQSLFNLNESKWEKAILGDEEDFARLGELNDPRGILPLVWALVNGSATIRFHAAQSLAKLGEPKWQAVIHGNNKDFIRLARLEDQRLVIPFRRAFISRFPETRMAAVEAIWNMSSPELLFSALDCPYADVRSIAAKSLDNLRREQLIEPLTNRLASRYPETRMASVNALYAMTAVESMIKALECPYPDVCTIAIRFLGEQGDLRAVDPLSRVLQSPNAKMRTEAAHALGVLCDQRAAAPLIRALEDNETEVRKAAVQALGNLHDPRLADTLIKMLDDKDTDVGIASINALARNGNPKAVEPLLGLLNNKNQNLRIATAHGLSAFGENQWQSIIRGDSDDVFRLASTRDPRIMTNVLCLVRNMLQNEKYGSENFNKSVTMLKNALNTNDLIAAFQDFNNQELFRLAALQALGNDAPLTVLQRVLMQSVEKDELRAYAGKNLAQRENLADFIKQVPYECWDLVIKRFSECRDAIGFALLENADPKGAYVLFCVTPGIRQKVNFHYSRSRVEMEDHMMKVVQMVRKHPQLIPALQWLNGCVYDYGINKHEDRINRYHEDWISSDCNHVHNDFDQTHHDRHEDFPMIRLDF